MGTAPRRTSSPRTSAPVKQARSPKRTSMGPTYEHKRFEPSAVVTSRSCHCSSRSCMEMCSGIQRCSAPVSASARVSTGSNSGWRGFFKVMLACTRHPIPRAPGLVNDREDDHARCFRPINQEEREAFHEDSSSPCDVAEASHGKRKCARRRLFDCRPKPFGSAGLYGGVVLNLLEEFNFGFL